MILKKNAIDKNATATVTFDTNKVQNTSYNAVVRNGIVFLNLDFTMKAGITGQQTIGSINYKPQNTLYTNVVQWSVQGGEKGAIKISLDGDIVIYNAIAGEEYTAYIPYYSK